MTNGTPSTVGSAPARPQLGLRHEAGAKPMQVSVNEECKSDEAAMSY